MGHSYKVVVPLSKVISTETFYGASGFKSAGCKRIWMKFGALRVYCLELALIDFGCDPRRSESRESSLNFVFLSRK